MPDRPRNISGSVRQRLLNLAHARGQPMELLLTRYALERFLHRLSLSPHRATRDVDLLGFGDPSREALLPVFCEVMAIEVDDGVSFDLTGAGIPITVDIGFGDAVAPPSRLSARDSHR